ncbi:ScbR family autoregulator-binding transcription factor [Streptomyces inusitatus]|nr:ScbR family autoregulator-binding transcription factor [Streptomyces inusitatus]
MTDIAERGSTGQANEGIKELKQERAIRTRTRILNAAAEAFASKGFPAVTILDVAELTGMTKGAVYFHYTNKEALAVAVIEEFDSRFPVVAKTVSALGLAPVAAVAELLTRTAIAFRDDTMMRAGARLQIERGLIRAALPLPYAKYTEIIYGWLKTAAEEDGLKPGTSPEALARVLVSAFFGAQHISWVLNDRADITERTLEVIRAVIPCGEGALLACPSIPDRGNAA